MGKMKNLNADYAVMCMLNDLGLKSWDFTPEGLMGENGNNRKIEEIKKLVGELMETMPKLEK